MSWKNKHCGCERTFENVCEKNIRFDIDQINAYNKYMGNQYNSFSTVYNDKYSYDKYQNIDPSPYRQCSEFIARHRCGNNFTYENECNNCNGCNRNKCGQFRIYSSYRSFLKVCW